MRHLCLWVGFLCVVGCSDGSDRDDTDAVQTLGSVLEKGPYAVGTLRGDFGDSVGMSIPVQVWYPSSATEGVSVAYDGIYPGTSWDGAPARGDTPHHVVMFSHGKSGIRWQSPFLMDFLASHGFVVAAMDHVTNTFLDHDAAQFPEHILQRPRNVRESFDWLVSESTLSDGPLAGCVDGEDGYAVMGHSFGGYTAYVTSGAPLSKEVLEGYCSGGQQRACDVLTLWQAENPDATQIQLGDPRVWAAVGLAPWDAYGLLGSGMADITVPILTLTGVEDVTTPLSMVQGLVNAIDLAPNDFGKMKDVGHFSFSPIACQTLTGDGCGDEFLDLETVMSLTNASVTAFLADTRGWNGAEEQFPVVSEYIDWE